MTGHHLALMKSPPFSSLSFEFFRFVPTPLLGVLPSAVVHLLQIDTLSLTISRPATTGEPHRLRFLAVVTLVPFAAGACCYDRRPPELSPKLPVTAFSFPVNPGLALPPLLFFEPPCRVSGEVTSTPALGIVYQSTRPVAGFPPNGTRSDDLLYFFSPLFSQAPSPLRASWQSTHLSSTS